MEHAGTHASRKGLNVEFLNENLSKEAALKASKGNASCSDSRLMQQWEKVRKVIALGEFNIDVD